MKEENIILGYSEEELVLLKIKS